MPTNPPVDYHQKRQIIQIYSTHVTKNLAMAIEATVTVSAPMQDVDSASASHLLKQRQEAATHAKEMSQSEVPDGYSEVD